MSSEKIKEVEVEGVIIVGDQKAEVRRQEMRKRKMREGK